MHLLAKSSLVAKAWFSFAFAQFDIGVQIKTDSFFGTQTCEQLSLNSYDDQTGLTLFKDEAKRYQLVISHETPSAASKTFGSTTQVVSERVTLYLDHSEQLFFTPFGTGNFNADLEVALISLDYFQVTRILGSSSDLRVRFETLSTANEFTIRHQVVRSLAKGFGLFCLERVSHEKVKLTNALTKVHP